MTFISAHGLDALYLEVLKQAFNTDNATVMHCFRSVMGRVLAVKEPLSVQALTELHSDGELPKTTKWVLQDLGSLLSGVNQDDVPVLALHASFFDFLRDEIRSKQFYVDLSLHHGDLTLSSLQIMKAGLQFNICKLETSHLQNHDVPHLAERIKKNISSALSYACCFWADHLIATCTPCESEILEHLHYFLYNQLLYWLEVLSLIKQVPAASSMLLLTSNWIQVCSSITDVIVLLTYAIFRMEMRIC
jgi:hypothetical protein